MSSRRVLRTWILGVVIVAAVAVLPAWASEEGQFAADQVSQASYIEFLDDWLFTHNGDSRGASGPDLVPARNNIAALMQSYGLTVTLEPFSYSSSTYHNVVGTKLGTSYPDQEFVIGAHYDSASNPGADDDASGVALVLEAARIISQYDSAYTIRFVAFSMEEAGLVGSEAYVAAHAGDDILGMVQADMVAYNTGVNYALIYSRGGPLMTALGAAVDEYGDGLTWVDDGWISLSDHAPFDSAGYESCAFTEGEIWSNPYYHTQQDSFETPGNLNFPYAVKLTRTVVGWLVDEAQVNVQTNRLSFSYPDGRPDFIDPAGGTTMRVEVIGHGTEVPQPGTAYLHYDNGDGWQSAAMQAVGPNLYDTVFPPAVCGTEVLYYVSASAVSAQVYTDPSTAPDNVFSTVSLAGDPTVVYSWNFSTSPGWTTQDQWAFGQPTGGGGQYGGPDPTSGHTGNYVYGYNLSGDYPNNLPERHLTSGPIDCTGLFDVHLRFWRWLGVEQPIYDHAYVRVSNNGSNWTTVWSNPAEIADSAWTEMDLDISDVADGQATVYLRWTMGTTDGGWRYCGWNIDDVSMTAIDCSAVPGAIIRGWSCLPHDAAGDLCLELDSGNVEPRQDGVRLLMFDVTKPVASAGATVDCVNTTYSGSVTTTAYGSTVEVELAPALPNKDCCTITLSGEIEDTFTVRPLPGDMDRSGMVTPGDASIIKPHFGEAADVDNCKFDYDGSGLITPGDFSQIKPKFGDQAPACP